MDVVVITGASSGIGRATARAFARTGAGLVLAARGREALQDTVEECRDLGGAAHLAPLDVTDPHSMTQLAHTAAQTFGRIDVWVNNAAVLAWGAVEEVTMEDFRRVVDVNLHGYVNGARAVLPYFRAQGRGVLVENVSLLGLLAEPYASAYVAAKHAVRGFDMALRQELLLEGARGIHVCTVLPGSVSTPLTRHASNRSGRVVTVTPPVDPPELVADAIVGLACRPRREVVVGATARTMAWRHRLAEGITERGSALLAGRLAREHSEEGRPADGALYLAAPPGQNAVHGAWSGRRRAVTGRAVAVAVGIAAVVAVARRRIRR